MGGNRLVLAAGIIAAAAVILIVAYALVSVLGIFGGSGSGVAMPVSPTPTPVPTPTERGTITPMPVATNGPTARPATPTPTVVPVKKCPLSMSIDMDFTIRLYSIKMNLTQGADPVDMGKVMISVTDKDKVYQNITYDQWAIANRVKWANSNGNSLLENGEYVTYDISGYSLGIPADSQAGITVYLNGEEIKRFSVPAMVTSVTIPPYTWEGPAPKPK